MNDNRYPFWKVAPHIYILGAGASRAAFPKGDKYGHILPLMNDLIDVIKVGPILNKYNIVYKDRNFEEVYDEIYSKDPDSRILFELNDVIHSYFSIFHIPDEVTLYDKIILSLQKKDAIFSFNWDPLLMQAFVRNIKMGELPTLYFLHGNVAIGICNKDKRVGHIGNKCSICNEDFKPSNLLFPIRDKDYSKDPFISHEWEAFENYLNDSFIMTIFGYSAPKTDIKAREMMLKAWHKNNKYDLNEIEIVDIKSMRNVEKNWSDFTYKGHYVIFKNITHTLSFRYARRSCHAWGDSIMMCDPWSERKIPRYRKLVKLQSWVGPLINEEIEFITNNVDMPQYKRKKLIIWPITRLAN